jgi:hypothetical protein
MVTYLTKRIVETRATETPRYGISADGYTLKSGAPTTWLIRLEGEPRFRRLMCWQFSNASTLFVRVKGEPLVVNQHDLPF